MKNIIKHKFFLLCIAYLASNCASTQAPRNWLEKPIDLRTDTYGAWLTIETVANTRLAGELIAVSKDSIFIAGETLSVFAKNNIKSARLVTYESNAGTMGTLVFLGTLSTLSNGRFFLFTAPLWIVGGSIASSNRSYEPIIDYPGQKWNKFVPFARYPQGLPPGLDRSGIRMKHK